MRFAASRPMESDLLRDWTLDDCPIMCRVMFNGAKCLDGLEIPHAHPSSAAENLTESVRRSTLPLHFTPADVPTTGAVVSSPPSWTRKSGNELWGYGDRGRGFAPESGQPAAHPAGGEPESTAVVGR